MILQQSVSESVYICTRDDGILELITEFLFADDTALIAHNPVQIQMIVNIFVEASNKILLQISTSKTEVIYSLLPDSNTPGEPVITINDEDP